MDSLAAESSQEELATKLNVTCITLVMGAGRIYVAFSTIEIDNALHTTNYSI
jgi:hypothetical protein